MKRLAIFFVLVAQYFLMSWAVERWLGAEPTPYTVYCDSELALSCQALLQAEDLPLSEVVYAAGEVLSYDPEAYKRPEGEAFLSALSAYQGTLRSIRRSQGVIQDDSMHKKLLKREGILRLRAKEVLKLVGTADV